MSIVPLDTFTDSDPKELPEEVERLIKRNDRRYTKWFRMLFRLGWHYGYTECLMREPARLVVEPDIKPLDTEDMDKLFTILQRWGNKRAKDPASLLKELRAERLIITRWELPFESLGGADERKG